MFFTLERCVEAWEEEKRTSHLGESYGNIENWAIYWDYLSDMYPDGQSGYQKKIVELLKNEGYVGSEMTVLDVGCGPGTYSIPFAEAEALSVDCVDSSRGMLSQLKQRAQERNVSEIIHLYPKTWAEFLSEKKYDLVFSSMSPAISEMSELMKMEKYSRKYCCLVTYGAGMPRSIRGLIWEKFLGKRVESKLFDAVYPFNILYSLGRNPNMKTFCQSGERLIPVEKAYEDSLHYFRIFGKDSSEDKKLIYHTIEENARDGLLWEDTTSYISAIYWQVI